MFTVVGIKKIVSKKDSTRFVELHLLSNDKFVDGVRCDTIFVREDMINNFDQLSLESSVQVHYNRYGRPETVDVLC
jgi:hypothetical protein